MLIFLVIIIQTVLFLFSSGYASDEVSNTVYKYTFPYNGQNCTILSMHDDKQLNDIYKNTISEHQLRQSKRWYFIPTYYFSFNCTSAEKHLLNKQNTDNINKIRNLPVSMCTIKTQYWFYSSTFKFKTILPEKIACKIYTEMLNKLTKTNKDIRNITFDCTEAEQKISTLNLELIEKQHSNADQSYIEPFENTEDKKSVFNHTPTPVNQDENFEENQQNSVNQKESRSDSIGQTQLTTGLNQRFDRLKDRTDTSSKNSYKKPSERFNFFVYKTPLTFGIGFSVFCLGFYAFYKNNDWLKKQFRLYRS